MKKYAEYGADPSLLEVPHRNMLKRAVLLFYQAGHIDKALQIYNTLRKEYPTDSEIQGSLTEYARTRLMNELATIGFNDATEIITLMLQEAYYRYALHDDDEAFAERRWRGKFMIIIKSNSATKVSTELYCRNSR